MNSRARRGTAAVLAVLLMTAAAACGDGDTTTTDGSTTTTTAESTTTTDTSSASEPTATAPTTAPPATAVPPTTGDTVDSATAVFPTDASPTRYATPTEVATAFAVDYLGFTDPVVGEYREGDSRSGEVGIQPMATGPETTVLVRQLGDDSWWVLGAATANIELDEPSRDTQVTSPVELVGSALAFEGTVQVELRADDVAEPLAETFVTGGGDVAGPFSGTVEFDQPAADFGALVLLTRSAEDGRVWEASVLRIAF